MKYIETQSSEMQEDIVGKPCLLQARMPFALLFCILEDLEYCVGWHAGCKPTCILHASLV